jgi:outer membrane protein
MKWFGIVTLVFLLSAFTNKVQSQQEKWSLQKCIEHALENNLQIKQQDLSVQISGNNKQMSLLRIAPTVNLGGDHSYNFGQTIDRYTNTFASDRVQSDNFYGSTRMTIFSGLQQYNNYKKSQLDFEASKLDAEQQRRDVVLTIVNSYLQILFAMELKSTAEAQVAITEQQVQRTKKLVEVGSLAKGNLFDMEAQLANEELAMVNAKNSLDLAYLNLAQQLVIVDVENFRILKPDLKLPSNAVLNESAASLVEHALMNQSNIKSAELKTLSAEKSVAISKGALLPSLSVSGSFGSGYSGAAKSPIGNPIVNMQLAGATESGEGVYLPTYDYTTSVIPFANQIDNNLNKSVGFSLTIPIFNGGQTHYGIKNAKSNLEITRLTEEQTVNAVTQNIQQAYYDSKAAYQKYLASNKSVLALKESFKYTNERFSVGMVNALDYNDAKNKLAKAESDLLQAKFEYIFTLKILDYYKGIDLGL